MQDFLQLVLKILRSPWTYVYWVISAMGIIASHRNTAADGFPLLGALSIASWILGTAVFYWHLRILRLQGDFRGKRSGMALFLAIWAFRLRLLILAAPLAVIFYYWRGYDELFKNYLNFSMALPEEKATALYMLVQEGVLWFCLLPVVWLINKAGTSFVVAQGNSERAVAKSIPAMLRQFVPVVLFTSASLIVFFGLNVLEVLGFFENSGWSLPALNIFRSFFSYLVELSGVLFIASRLWERSPELFSEELK